MERACPPMFLHFKLISGPFLFHFFWENKNIVIWPHVSAETNVETAAEQVAKAIKLIHSGKVPKNKIDLNLGY